MSLTIFLVYIVLSSAVRLGQPFNPKDAAYIMGTGYCCALRNSTCDFSMALPKYNYATNGKLAPPRLQCKTENIFYFEWPIPKDAKNACYILEAGSEKTEKIFSNVTMGNSSTLQPLRSNTAYNVRLWQVDQDGNVAMSVMQTVATTSDYHQPLAVRNVTVTKLEIKDNGQAATVKWLPAEDKSCFYEIIWIGGLNEDLEQEEINIMSHKQFQYTIMGLHYDSNYSIAIASKNLHWDMESPKMWTEVLTKSCLYVYSNLDKCAPNTPQNLVVLEERNVNDSLYDVYLEWSRPTLEPTYYTVGFANLLPESPDGYPQTKEMNVSGKYTMAKIDQVKLGTLYHISLTASSKAGTSEPAIITRHFMPTPKARHWTAMEYTLVTLTPTALIIVTAIIALILKKQQKSSPKTNFTQQPPLGIYFSKSSDEWELQRNQIELGAVLGNGAFGVVRVGRMCDGRKVAVKMLKPAGVTDDAIRYFSMEIEIMKSVGRHPHLVSIIGCVTTDWPLMLIVEFCAGGDLQTYLRSLFSCNRVLQTSGRNTQYSSLYSVYANDQKQEEHHQQTDYNEVANKMYDYDNSCEAHENLQVQLFSYARQVILGMQHLAHMKVVHRDLAARNVLISDKKKLIVKIADFGLSRDVYQDSIYYKESTGRIPIRWMALESLTHQVYTIKSDIWSFGVLLWEIVTLGANPYPGIETHAVLDAIQSGYRMECPSNCPKIIHDVMGACWNENPKCRPSFDELLSIFDALLQQETNYLTLQPSCVRTSGKSDSMENYMNPNE